MSQLHIQMLYLLPIIGLAVYVVLMGEGVRAEEVTTDGQENNSPSTTETHQLSTKA